MHQSVMCNDALALAVLHEKPKHSCYKEIKLGSEHIYGVIEDPDSPVLRRAGCGLDKPLLMW